MPSFFIFAFPQRSRVDTTFDDYARDSNILILTEDILSKMFASMVENTRRPNRTWSPNDGDFAFVTGSRSHSPCRIV